MSSFRNSFFDWVTIRLYADALLMGISFWNYFWSDDLKVFFSMFTFALFWMSSFSTFNLLKEIDLFLNFVSEPPFALVNPLLLFIFSVDLLL